MYFKNKFISKHILLSYSNVLYNLAKCTHAKFKKILSLIRHKVMICIYIYVCNMAYSYTLVQRNKIFLAINK